MKRDSSLTGYTNGVASERRAFPGASILEGPNSVLVTFSRRSPAMQDFSPWKPGATRQKRPWNFTRRSHVRSCKRSFTDRSHQQSGSHRREEEGPNSVLVTFSRRSSALKDFDLRNQAQPRQNGPGILPVGHMCGVAILWKTPNLVVKISNNYKILCEADHIGI